MGFLISINSNGTPAGRGPRGPAGRASAHTSTSRLYGAGMRPTKPCAAAAVCFDRVDRAITLLRQAGILAAPNCPLTPHNAGDLGASCYAAERDLLILEVNTYMFPLAAATRPWSGGTTASPPAETAHYHMGALPPAARRGGLHPLPAEHPAAASPRPPVWTDCVDPRDCVSCRGQRLSSG